jgi:hypothetical protein
MHCRSEQDKLRMACRPGVGRRQCDGGWRCGATTLSSPRSWRLQWWCRLAMAFGHSRSLLLRAKALPGSSWRHGGGTFQVSISLLRVPCLEWQSCCIVSGCKPGPTPGRATAAPVGVVTFLKAPASGDTVRSRSAYCSWGVVDNGGRSVVGHVSGGCFPLAMAPAFLLVAVGLHLSVIRLFAAFRGAWCCRAFSSAMRDIVVLMVLATTTTCGDLACSGSRRGFQLC